MAPRTGDNSSNSNNNGKKKKPTIVTISDFRRQNSQSVASNGGSNSNSKSNDGFCQPAGGGGNPPPKVIPAYVIPNIPKSDICEETLKRILTEFEPIIRGRGYNVRSISELCCCGDGLDSKKGGGGGRKRKLMSHNVLGYNMTSTQGRRGGRGGYKSHTIHLRLRDPRDHTILFPYEDVAGTMAHELAHCVHGPHDDKFFALMEEIMEEHDRIRIYGPHGPSFLKPTNLGTIGRTPVGMPPTAAVPFGGASGSDSTGSGHRLGGQGAGKSRLIDLGGSGRKLGGGESSHGYNPRQLRELALQAAERRKHKMDRIRRAIEQAKTPCVIDLTNDDDDDDEQEEQGKSGDYKTSAASAKSKSRNKENDQAAKKRPAVKSEKSVSSSSSGKKRPPQEQQDRNKARSKSNNKGKNVKAEGTTLIDLTADDDDDDIKAERFPTAATKNWTCKTCTYINTSDETECEVCFTPKS